MADMMPPPGGPMMAPQGPTGPATVGAPNDGQSMRGAILISMAIKALEQGIQLVGSTSEQGKVAVDALSKLAKAFGQPSGDLQRSEVKMLGETAAPMPQPGPAQMGAFQNMIKGKLQGMGMGGAGAAPPPMPSAPAPAGAPPM